MIAALVASALLPSGPPAYAKVLGITLGISTQAELEARIGKGKVTVGTHSNSRRGCHFRSCEMDSDGSTFFQYKTQTPVIDVLAIRSWKGRYGDIKQFRKFKRSWLADMVSGASIQECQSSLAKWNIRPLGEPGGLILRELRNVDFFGSKDRVVEYWIEWLFENGRLGSIVISSKEVLRD